jgi:DNA-binding beta-propeller fold protein YncE
VFIVCLAMGCSASGAKAYEDKYPRIDMALGFAVEPSWPKRPKDVTWEAVTGVTVDRQDHVYVYTRGTPPVQVYDASGRYVRGWGQDILKAAHFISIDPKGNVWVPDIECHTVRKFTPEGKLLLTLGTEDEPGCDKTHFNQPTDIAVTPSGDVFVSDGYGNNRVVHFDANGTFVKAWGKLGTKPGEFSIPHAIEVDSKGRLYVCDRNSARVQVFNQAGAFLAEWRNLLVPWGIHITKNDEIWICGSSPMRWPKEGGFGGPPKDQLIMKFDPSGKLHQLWTLPLAVEGKAKPGQVNIVHGIGVDTKGNVYLGDVGGKRVQKFVPLR